jgi:AbrB family looped-hinge helix DNA binding protein
MLDTGMAVMVLSIKWEFPTLGGCAMDKLLAIRIDDKGRIHVPRAVRHTLHLEPGDVCFLDIEDGALRVRRADNPFDRLAREAIDEANRGDMIPLSQLLAVDPGDPDPTHS